MGADRAHVQADEAAGETVRSTLSTYAVHNVDLAKRIRRAAAAAAAALATFAAAVPSTANADPPTRVTIVAVFSPITYGDNAYVNGQLFGTDQAGQPVILEQATPPAFVDWTPIAQVNSDAAAYYSFKLHPTQTMQYRTSSQNGNSERAVQIAVAPRIRLKASAAGSTSVRFSGTVAPALAGQSVEIQRQSPSGGWTRVTTARLRGGKTFAGRIRTRKTVHLRAFYAGDPLYVAGTSNVVKATP
jgi:hypothetical protein